MSGILKVGGSELINDNGGSGSLQWSSGLPSGSIVQVQYFQKTDIADMTNINNDTYYVLQNSTSPSTSASTTGIIQVAITPKIIGSKMWLQVSWFGEQYGSDVPANMMWVIYRDTTILRAPAAGARPTGINNTSLSYYASNANSTPENAYFQYFDTHGISAGTQITYKLGFIQTNGASQTISTNKTVTDTNSASFERGISSICAIELAP